MTTSVTDEITQYLDERDARAAAEKEAAELRGIAEAIRDMERLDKEAARGDAALLERAQHPGSSVVYLN